MSAISIWEFCKLIEKGRLTITIQGQEWISDALQMKNLTVVPLSPQIAWNSCNLPGNFHPDPADQIIVATAQIERATILSKDNLIRKYPYVKTIW